jgi:Ca2+/Na+ antiporter
MGDIVEIILSNKYYMVLAVCIISVIIIFVIKKAIKLFIYALVILIAFLAYLYFTGKSVNSAIDPVEKAVKRTERIIK